jgi:hypothetical protein
VGESPKQPFQFSFNASLKIDFQSSRVTSDGGLVLVRELDERGGGEKVSETSVKREIVPSRRSLRGVNTRRPVGPWGHGATLTGRQLQSLPVRCMLRSVVGVENGNSGLGELHASVALTWLRRVGMIA